MQNSSKKQNIRNACNVALQDVESSNWICRQYFYHVSIHIYVEIPRIFVKYSQEKIFSTSNYRTLSLSTHKKKDFLYYDKNK